MLRPEQFLYRGAQVRKIRRWCCSRSSSNLKTCISCTPWAPAYIVSHYSPAMRRFRISAWRKCHSGGNKMYSTATIVVAMQLSAEPTKVGIATSKCSGMSQVTRHRSVGVGVQQIRWRSTGRCGSLRWYSQCRIEGLVRPQTADQFIAMFGPTDAMDANGWRSLVFLGHLDGQQIRKQEPRQENHVV